MAKTQDKQSTDPTPQQPDPPASSDVVRVRVHKAIAYGGTVLRPRIDGKTVIPAEHDIPRRVAESYGRRHVEIVS